MGLQLRLLPIEGIKEEIKGSGNFLNCEKDKVLFEQIEQINASTVPSDFQAYHDTEEGFVYGSLTKDAYGTELNYVFVKELLKFKPNSESQTNKAIWAYLKQLPPEGKIALYWN